MRILALNKETKNDLLESLLKRSPNHYGEFEGRVNEIVSNVRVKKDAALFEYYGIEKVKVIIERRG